jgi:hypothetical protein
MIEYIIDSFFSFLGQKGYLYRAHFLDFVFYMVKYDLDKEDTMIGIAHFIVPPIRSRSVYVSFTL